MLLNKLIKNQRAATLFSISNMSLSKPAISLVSYSADEDDVEDTSMGLDEHGVVRAATENTAFGLLAGYTTPERDAEPTVEQEATQNRPPNATEAEDAMEIAPQDSESLRSKTPSLPFESQVSLYPPDVDFSSWGPPPVTAPPDPVVVEAVQKAHLLKRGGRSVNRELRKMKSFNNPDILDKLVVMCHIDQYGSNFPPEIYNPHAFQPEDYFDAIAKAQEEYYKKLQQMQAKRAAMEFMRQK